MRSKSAFLRQQPADIIRREIIGGETGSEQTVATVYVLEPWPLNAMTLPESVMQRLPENTLAVIVEDPEGALSIMPGDVLRYQSGKQYTVRYVEQWPWRTGYNYLLALEE